MIMLVSRVVFESIKRYDTVKCLSDKRNPSFYHFHFHFYEHVICHLSYSFDIRIALIHATNKVFISFL